VAKEEETGEGGGLHLVGCYGGCRMEERYRVHIGVYPTRLLRVQMEQKRTIRVMRARIPPPPPPGNREYLGMRKSVATNCRNERNDEESLSLSLSLSLSRSLSLSLHASASNSATRSSSGWQSVIYTARASGSSSPSFAVCENNCRRLWSSLARTSAPLFLAPSPHPMTSLCATLYFRASPLRPAAVCIELCRLYDGVARACVIRGGKYEKKRRNT